MTRFHIFRLAAASIVVAFLAVPAGMAQQTSRPWPPVLAGESRDAPVLTPSEEMKTFALPAGYHVELVASEPMIQEPIAIDWDTKGRLWVIEMLGYMQDMPATNEREPIGRVSVLEDVDRDGRMDKKTVFLDGLVLPRALKVLDRGVLIAEPPNLWLAHDTNGDLRADTKDLITNTFGRLDGNVEHNANTLLWALDNRIHTSEADIFLEPTSKGFDVRKTVSRGQWGASQDDVGRIYRNSNESVLHVDLVPTPYYARNDNLVRTRGSYESLRGPNDEVMTVWPAHPTRGVNRGYQTGVLREDGTLAAYTAAASPTVYRGDRLPDDLRGNVFVVDPAGNLVSRIIVTDNPDGTIVARKAYERAEFLTSTDERFRPVYLSNAPDGTLYLVDMYHGIIQHKAYITEYLRDQILARNLDKPIGHGRIYRIVHDTTAAKPSTTPATASAADLVALLRHPNGWWRDTAQRLLVERGDRAAAAQLKKMAASDADARTRLHALWTLDGLQSLEPALVAKALVDRSRDVRLTAVRLAERWLGQPGHSLQAAVRRHVDDPDPAVRRQVAASLGSLPPREREAALASMLEHNAADPIVVDAAISSLAGSEQAVLSRLLESTSETPQRAVALTMLAATIVRAGKDAPVQTILEWVSDGARPEWQRIDLLRGAEVTLLSAIMPGGGGGRRGSGRGNGAEGSNEPGARGGPGSASAFPRSSAAPTRPARPPALQLSREPALASVAANGQTELGRRASDVLARIVWPGKPSTAAPVAPLTADEQQRFAAGKDIYQTLCAACHQPDGRGREHVAPSLVGSDLALGPSVLPVRVVLNGKEGSTGLMPPLGSVLTDEQIAAALTYIRREWGHTSSPVDATTVEGVRRQVAGRTRPWTAEELSRIGGQ